MEKIVSKYQLLAGVDILHHYLLDEGNRVFGGALDLPLDRKQKKLAAYNVHDWLEITPDDATLRTMQGANLILKKTKTGFILIAAVQNQDVPKINVEGLSLHFLLRVSDPEVASHTALPTITWQDNLPMQYVFGNEISRTYRAPYPSLSLPAGSYLGSQTYQPGDIVKVGSQQFVARVSTTGNAPPNAQFWRETDGTLPYATRRNIQPKTASERGGMLGKVSIVVKAGTSPFHLLTPLKKINPNSIYQLHFEKRS